MHGSISVLISQYVDFDDELLSVGERGLFG